MHLYEYEGKNLFRSSGIPTPEGIVLSRDTLDTVSLWNTFPCVLKVQTLSGKRGQRGGIIVIENRAELLKKCAELLAGSFAGEEVLYLLIEKKQDIAQEYYLAITYNTTARKPMMLFSPRGGVAIEENNMVYSYMLNPLRGFEEFRARALFIDGGISGSVLCELITVAKKLWGLFKDHDARLAEINPLCQCSDGSLYAIDAKIILDDDASYRHTWEDFPERTIIGHRMTERERAAQKIDQGDFYYRGTASKYIELDGDIACLFSGGGASISMMDALFAAGGAPANYTEYSGNPSREKVYRLARIVLSKPGLRGVWIVGGVANFTHIGETMAGIADALKELRPSIPIVIRRAGPHEADGKTLMETIARECHLNIEWYGREVPMTETASILLNNIKHTHEYSR